MNNFLIFMGIFFAITGLAIIVISVADTIIFFLEKFKDKINMRKK